MSSTTAYLNVDLEIRATLGLDELIEALAPTCFVLHHEHGQWATFELLEECETPDQAIQVFCDAITAFRPEHRTLWDRSEGRCFDIGIEAGLAPYSMPFQLKAETISKIATANAQVVVTIYAAKDDAVS